MEILVEYGPEREIGKAKETWLRGRILSSPLRLGETKVYAVNFLSGCGRTPGNC